MSITAQIRRGQGPVWGRIKRLAQWVLHLHLPAHGPAQPLFSMLYAGHVLLREALQWGARFFWYEPLFRSQCAHVGRRLRMEQLPYLTGRGRLVIGDDVYLSGKPDIGFNSRFQEHFGSQPELIVGDGTFIGHGCNFAVARSIRIGRHCLLAAGAKILDIDGHPLDAEERRRHLPPPPQSVAPVQIGDDVWIGRDAMILKGVRIGDRSIVGGGAVVTRSVPADCIVAGNPARVVRRLTPPQADAAITDDSFESPQRHPQAPVSPPVEAEMAATTA